MVAGHTRLHTLRTCNRCFQITKSLCRWRHPFKNAPAACRTNAPRLSIRCDLKEQILGRASSGDQHPGSSPGNSVHQPWNSSAHLPTHLVHRCENPDTVSNRARFLFFQSVAAIITVSGLPKHSTSCLRLISECRRYDEICEAHSPPLPLWERVGMRVRSGARRPFILRGGSTRPMIVSSSPRNPPGRASA